MLFKVILFQTITLSDRTDIADTCAGRFFHHIPQFTGQSDLSLSRHYIYFDLKSDTANTGPCKSTDKSHFICLIGHLILVFLFSKIFMQVSLCHTDSFLFIFQDLTG